MKIITLIAGGRAGTDLFQSLLDMHPEISQFPGAFFFDDFQHFLTLLRGFPPNPRNLPTSTPGARHAARLAAFS